MGPRVLHLLCASWPEFWAGGRGEATKPQTGGQPQLGIRPLLKGEGSSWALANLPDGTGPTDTDCSGFVRGWGLPQWHLTALCLEIELFTLLLPFEPT